VTGLSFDLTEEQEQLRQAVRDFTERECPKDVARRIEAAKDFPEDLARRIAKAGLNGIGIPEEYGGQGGDLLERDSQGRFRFHSRLSDVLKVGGENVSAAEVEDRIAGLPGVCVVQVVAAPDGHYGEVAAAFVELRPGASLTEAEVVGHCLERLATFKVPRYVRFVSEWPMSGTKIQKARLRQRIAAELAAAAVTEAARLTRPA
jgi:hypothetical protein